MSVRETFVTLVGIIAATFLAGLLINACTNLQYKNADTSRQAKITCIQNGGSWTAGSCVYSRVPAK